MEAGQILKHRDADITVMGYDSYEVGPKKFPGTKFFVKFKGGRWVCSCTHKDCLHVAIIQSVDNRTGSGVYEGPRHHTSNGNGILRWPIKILGMTFVGLAFGTMGFLGTVVFLLELSGFAHELGSQVISELSGLVGAACGLVAAPVAYPRVSAASMFQLPAGFGGTLLKSFLVLLGLALLGAIAIGTNAVFGPIGPKVELILLLGIIWLAK